MSLPTPNDHLYVLFLRRRNFFGLATRKSIHYGHAQPPIFRIFWPGALLRMRNSVIIINLLRHVLASVRSGGVPSFGTSS